MLGRLLVGWTTGPELVNIAGDRHDRRDARPAVRAARARARGPEAPVRSCTRRCWGRGWRGSCSLSRRSDPPAWRPSSTSSSDPSYGHHRLEPKPRNPATGHGHAVSGGTTDDARRQGAHRAARVLCCCGRCSTPRRLKRASEAQPLGTRRTVSLWVLNPLAAMSNGLQLTKLTDGVSSALGRDPDAAPGGDVDDIVLPPIQPDASPSAKPDEPVTETTPMRTPTPQDQLRVVVVGDSLSQGLGVYMEGAFRQTLVRVSQQGRLSTGLARLDYFDWLGGMREIDGSLPARPGDRDDRRQRQPEPADARRARPQPRSAASNGPRATRSGSRR